jgi:hypothetical protein
MPATAAMMTVLALALTPRWGRLAERRFMGLLRRPWMPYAAPCASHRPSATQSVRRCAASGIGSFLRRHQVLTWTDVWGGGMMADSACVAAKGVG